VLLALPQSSFARSTSNIFRRSHSYQGLGPRHDLTRSRPLIVLLGHAGFARRSLRRLREASKVAVGFHTVRFGPSSGALSLSTVYSAIGLAGLFHPAAMFRTTPFRGFSLRAAVLSHRESLAPRPFDPHVLPGCPAATRTNLGFEALFHAEQRCTNKR
jgi:hypothetical protein